MPCVGFATGLRRAGRGTQRWCASVLARQRRGAISKHRARGPWLGPRSMRHIASGRMAMFHNNYPKLPQQGLGVPCRVVLMLATTSTGFYRGEHPAGALLSHPIDGFRSWGTSKCCLFALPNRRISILESIRHNAFEPSDRQISFVESVKLWSAGDT